jgi:transcriptional regulator with GAF, ATPase, and Fis domain
MPGMSERPFLLIVRRGDHNETHTFHKPSVTIGRSRDNDLALDDRLVSRRHCRVERLGDGFLLVDDGGQNPVKVRGKAVQRAELAIGDAFRVGSFEIMLGAPPEPAVASVDETAHGEAQGSSADLAAFIAIARALNEEHDQARLLTLIVDSAIQLVGAERGFLLLGRGAEPSVEVARNFAQEEVATPEFKISRTIARRVRDSGVPELTTNAQEDDRFRDLRSVEDLRLRSVMCVAIRIRGTIGGVLYVDNRLQQQVFKEREMRLLTSLADHAGIAIHNARTMHELRGKHAELQAAVDRVAQLNAQLKGQLASQGAELTEIREELASSSARGYRHDYKEIVGESRRMREVFALLDKYIETEEPVLILGESGTGKELVARAVWSQGRRAKGPFVTENVAALPESLLESELFGYVKGAFTGATSSKPGLLESASGGVLFLDEIGDMPLDLQAKLLRVIQEGEVRRLGSRDTVKIDVRLITATNRNLDEMVRDGDFRQDLYYRLNVLPIRLPPLRERREDVPRLVNRFLIDLARESKGARMRISPDAMEVLAAYHWPGNVRELQNEIRRSAILCDGVILADHLSERVRHPPQAAPDDDDGPVPAESGATLPDLVRDLEVREIGKAYRRAGGNKSRAAEMLGLSRFALQRKLDKYRIGEAEGGGESAGDDADAGETTP